MLTLTARDFYVTKGTRGQILCNGIKGMCLLMFYSPTCMYCKHFFPSFQNLSKSISGCSFGILNVSKNKEIIAMSEGTITPIKYVPYIILYVDGKPYMRYDGPKEEEEIRKFLSEIIKRLSIYSKFATGNVQIDADRKIEQKKKDDIPVYTVGVPITDNKNVCYVAYEEAYGGGGKRPQGGSANQTACYHCYDDAYGGTSRKQPPRQDMQSYQPPQSQQQDQPASNPAYNLQQQQYQHQQQQYHQHPTQQQQYQPSQQTQFQAPSNQGYQPSQPQGYPHQSQPPYHIPSDPSGQPNDQRYSQFNQRRAQQQSQFQQYQQQHLPPRHMSGNAGY